MSDQKWVRRIFEQGRYTVIGLVVAVLVVAGTSEEAGGEGLEESGGLRG